LIRINAPLPGARYEILSMSRLRVRAALEGAIDMELLTQRMWSPYAAGIVIGLLQIPAFLLIETALGTSSSYVTVGGAVASIHPSLT
jgi:hypothetical protein